MSSFTTGSSLSCSSSPYPWFMISTTTPGTSSILKSSGSIILHLQEQDCVRHEQRPHQAQGEGGEHPEAGEGVSDQWGGEGYVHCQAGLADYFPPEHGVQEQDVPHQCKYYNTLVSTCIKPTHAV